jgi:hypothetical protein
LDVDHGFFELFGVVSPERIMVVGNLARTSHNASTGRNGNSGGNVENVSKLLIARIVKTADSRHIEGWRG